MNPPNIKIYIMVSGVLILLFLVVTFVPFGRKTDNLTPENLPVPTLVEIDQRPGTINLSPTVAPADFTGAAIEDIPQEIIDAATQKQNLRSRAPLDTGLFQIDFDYNEDKFVVVLAEPKSENRQQFDQWLKQNYSGLITNQFNFR